MGAKAELEKRVKAAEKFAKQNGVTVNFDKILNQLNKEYGKQAEQMANKAQRQGKAAYNQNRNMIENTRNSNQFQQNKDQVLNADFASVLQMATDQLLNAAGKVQNKAVKKNLKNIIKSAKKEAENQMDNYDLEGKIADKVQAEGMKAFKKVGGQKKVNQIRKNTADQIKKQINQNL